MLDVDQCKQYDSYSSTLETLRTFRDMYKEYINIDTGIVLDLGSGTCSFVVFLCQSFPNLKFVCYEESKTMLEIARKKIEDNNLTDRITLIEQDLFTAQGKYDVVIANRVLHHIEDTKLFWETVTKLSDNILVIDINRPDSELVEQLSKANINIVYRTDLVNSMKAAYTVDEVKEQVKDYPLTVFADEANRLIVHHNK